MDFMFGWIMVCAPLIICAAIAIATCAHADYYDHCEKKGKR